jgi:hypothetical protein
VPRAQTQKALQQSQEMGKFEAHFITSKFSGKSPRQCEKQARELKIGGQKCAINSGPSQNSAEKRKSDK